MKMYISVFLIFSGVDSGVPSGPNIFLGPPSQSANIGITLGQLGRYSYTLTLGPGISTRIRKMWGDGVSISMSFDGPLRPMCIHPHHMNTHRLTGPCACVMVRSYGDDMTKHPTEDNMPNTCEHKHTMWLGGDTYSCIDCGWVYIRSVVRYTRKLIPFTTDKGE